MESIGVAVIASNAEKTIKACLESFKDHVDQTVVVVNNSTDKTREICESIKGIEVYEFEWVDDFAIARNYSYSKLKTDWQLWVDADDVIVNPENLREIVELSQPEIGGVWFPYNYARDEFKNLSTTYERERLLRAKYGWVWRGRVHETVSPLFPCQYVRTDKVTMLHNHLAGPPRHERNFKLLYLMLEEDPEDKRIWLYLGHQHFANGEWIKAAEWYLKFGSDTGALPLERFQALCYCSKAMREIKDRQAIDVAIQALALFPDYKDGYLELAHNYLVFGEYEKAIQFAEIANIDLTKAPPSIIFINPLEYSFNRLALMSEAYLKLGNLDVALKYAEEAHLVRPADNVKQNIQYVGQLIEKNTITEGIKKLAVHLLRNRELVKLKALLASVPYWFKETEEYVQLRNGVEVYTKDVLSQPLTYEGEGKTAYINASKILDLKEYLADIDKDYDRVFVTLPDSEDRFDTLCKSDVEELLISAPDRHIVNFHMTPLGMNMEYDKTMPSGMLIRFFVGQGLELWTPQTIREKGCGGSETSVAMVAHEMAKMGHQPIVYAMGDEVWDGVLYRHHSKFQPDAGVCNLFIASRIPTVFNYPIHALQKWLWVHDICCFQGLTPEVASQLDVIITLTHWQADFMKRTYPWLKDAEVIDMDDQDKTFEDLWSPLTYFPNAKLDKLPRIAIIGDATDTTRFENLNITKVPHSFIWCSSPDRGLEQILNMWPLLKEKLPDATLKIFYGWEYFDSSLFIPAQRTLKEKIRSLVHMDGIEWCGRIGQDELALELGKAQCMLYPPPHDFRETYGIAFLEAQAAGCIVFYRQTGALGETVGNRGIPLPLDSTQEQIINKIVETLGDEGLCYNISKAARNYGLNRSWDKQAEKMLKLYNRIAGVVGTGSISCEGTGSISCVGTKSDDSHEITNLENGAKRS